MSIRKCIRIDHVLVNVIYNVSEVKNAHKPKQLKDKDV